MKVEFILSERFAMVEFNEQNWIALRPVVIAANVNYHHEFQKLQRHHILSKEYKIFKVDVESKGIIQKREMVFLPEKYFYGWLATLPLKTDEGKKYQMNCYNELFNHLKIK